MQGAKNESVVGHTRGSGASGRSSRGLPLGPIRPGPQCLSIPFLLPLFVYLVLSIYYANHLVSG